MRDSPGQGAQRRVPQSGLWSERRESPRSGVSGTRAEPAASGREGASGADGEAPREQLAPGDVCGYVGVIKEWTTKRETMELVLTTHFGNDRYRHADTYEQLPRGAGPGAGGFPPRGGGG